MNISPPSDVEENRRAFLRRSGQLALAGTALPFALNLAAFGEAAAFQASDYKALVCIFLVGGNDYANTVVAYDTPSHARYAPIRGGLAIARSALASTVLMPATPLPDDRQYAVHPTMGALAGMFNAGKAAIQLNVGPLVVPLTLDQYKSPDKLRYPLPPKLFSHNDQQAVWQNLDGVASSSGWGGRIGDLALSSNANAAFTCVGTSGNAIYLSGRTALQYQIATAGAVKIASIKNKLYDSAAVKAAMATLIQRPSAHLLENEYVRITARSIATEAQVTAAIGTSSAVRTAFPAGNELADQLSMVARLIAARAALGATARQVFFVQLGGFDLHDLAAERHPALLTKLSGAIAAFYNATVELGVASQVTSFTASDFGRTLAVNGNGSDHGWGSHHFVVGGAVKGKAFYGTPPPVSIGNSTDAEDQWHVGQGRLLPTTSVEQYAATLARWFGVADAELDALLPNLKNFGAAAGRPDYPRDMGYFDQGPG